MSGYRVYVRSLCAVVAGSWASRIVFEQAESILVFLLGTHIPAVVRYF